ncbi:hypothetical protein AX14_010185, partial [Amanita brunnescens Koide BX004]
ESARKRGKCKVISPVDLADEDAVQSTVNMYLDYFSRPDINTNIDDVGAGEIWEDVVADLGDMVQKLGHR